MSSRFMGWPVQALRLYPMCIRMDRICSSYWHRGHFVSW